VTAASFAASASPGSNSPTKTVLEPSQCDCGADSVTRVGQDRLSHSAADEALEARIKRLGALSIAAYKAGKLILAMRLSAAMIREINSRRPEVQAARHAEFEKRISEGVDYFQSEHALELSRQYLGGS
jgi:hypothetical protein